MLHKSTRFYNDVCIIFDETWAIEPFILIFRRRHLSFSQVPTRQIKGKRHNWQNSHLARWLAVQKKSTRRHKWEITEVTKRSMEQDSVLCLVLWSPMQTTPLKGLLIRYPDMLLTLKASGELIQLAKNTITIQPWSLIKMVTQVTDNIFH